MRLNALAGITLRICEGLDDSMGLGFPSTYILNEELPLTVMLSCASTVTIGTLRSISSIVIDLLSTSSSTL